MSKGPVDAEVMSRLRHDIKNQLSTIHMALEALKYETPDPSEDFTFCMNTILTSVTKINDLLKNPQ